MKKVALIGSEGYIGKHLNYFLAHQGYNVSCYDLIETNNYCVHYCDVLNREQIKVIDFNVDYIYMFAGLTGTKKGFDRYRDFLLVNELGLVNILDAISKSSFRPKVIFPSSRLVYKGSEMMLSEEAEKEAKTIYAVNKIACENLLSVYANMYGIPYTIFRICVPFGNMLSKDYSFGTIGFFIRQAIEKGVISLYGDGSLKRTFTSMEDLCKQIETVSQKEDSVNQVYNVGGSIHSLSEVAEMIARSYGASVRYVPFPDSDMRIESGSTFFDSSKIEKLTGYKTYQDIDFFVK